MTRRLDRLRGGRTEQRFSLDDLAEWFTFNGSTYFGGGLAPGVSLTQGGQKVESIPTTFSGYARAGFKGNGVVFSCIYARMRLFTEARFKFRNFNNGRPGDLYGTPALSILETPWPNGTTAALLARMEVDASLAGNAYLYRQSSSLLKRLRPDCVEIIVGSPTGSPYELDSRPLGYLYTPPGSREKIMLDASEVVHFAPIPDPDADYRGMSWLSPVIDEIQADQAATRHKRKFFENAATPNLAVTLSEKVSPEAAEKFKQMMDAKHQGVENAYKTMYVGGGADVKVVGADLKQLDFKVTQGAGETRIAAAAGVPPIIVGLSEGLEAATYSNYGQARKAFGNLWARPQWREAAHSLAPLVAVPAGSELWYDDRDIPFLQEDQQDAAQVLQSNANAIRTLTDGGYEPQSVIAAVNTGDLNLLTHTGMVPVQLQPPGTGDMNAPA